MQEEPKDKVFNTILSSKLSELNKEIKALTEKLKTLHKHQDAIFVLLSSDNGSQEQTLILPLNNLEKADSESILSENSIRQQVINAAVNLIKRKNRPVSNKEIMRYLNASGIRFNAQNPSAMLAAILSHETRRSVGKLMKKQRGFVKLRDEFNQE